MEKVYESYIKTTPERLWHAITDPELRARYNFGASIRSDWTKGSRYSLAARNGTVPLGEGENLEVDPPRRLVQSMVALWSDDVKREGTSRLTFEITPIGDSCRLIVTHDQLRDGAHGELYGGWPMILSGLKTLLETGESLTTPGSLHYSEAAVDAARPRAGERSAALVHQVWIDAPIAKVYGAIATADGVSRWWSKQTAVETASGLVLQHDPGSQHGVVALKVLETTPNARVEWECISTHPESSPASAWTGTHLLFELSMRADQTILDFRHSGWDENSVYFGFCNFAWGDALSALKRVCEA